MNEEEVYKSEPYLILKDKHNELIKAYNVLVKESAEKDNIIDILRSCYRQSYD